MFTAESAESAEMKFKMISKIQNRKPHPESEKPITEDLSMMKSEEIKEILNKVRENLAEKFRDNLKCLILYGSWAKGTARENSDIDLLAIFDRLEPEVRKAIHKMVWDADRDITIEAASLDDFREEKLPLYTAIKREGEVIWGEVDRSILPTAPEVKYSEFIIRSHEFESSKIKIAQELLEKDLISGIAEICFVASKHAIQAALAMKGQGYSSKIAVLRPLAERYFGKEIAEAFRKLFGLYIKTEYGLEFSTNEEAKLAVEYSKEILKVYESVITDKTA
jgi:predicted nucleotidyltransferase